MTSIYDCKLLVCGFTSLVPSFALHYLLYLADLDILGQLSVEFLIFSDVFHPFFYFCGLLYLAGVF